MDKTIYITVSIPYVNASPHIGYALELIQADTLNRYYKEIKKSDTYFLAGSDENAIKNVESAEKQGITTQELVDKNSAIFASLKETLNLSFDQFIRTTSAKHFKGAQKLWSLCKEDIYKDTYSGLYCVGCETFYKDGEFPDNICPLHKRKLELVEEENYFFNLKKYESELKKRISNDEIHIYPTFRKQEMLNLIEKGLENFSISRPNERTKGWGVPIPVEKPGDENQRMYVWFDALTNYISALDFAADGELYQQYWVKNPNRIHIIGKDIIKFHSLYWPAMLLAAGVNVPSKLFVHGFITVDGQKMSKTIGNVIDPFEVVKKFGIDPIRYYLLREIPSLDDGDFSERRFHEVYNADLANGLGNLVARISTLCEKNEVELTEKAFAIPPLAEENGYSTHIENFQFNLALEALWKDVKKIDTEINQVKPWSLSKEDATKFLEPCSYQIRNLAYALQPFIPETAAKVLEVFKPGKVKKSPILFPKFD